MGNFLLYLLVKSEYALMCCQLINLSELLWGHVALEESQVSVAVHLIVQIFLILLYPHKLIYVKIWSAVQLNKRPVFLVVNDQQNILMTLGGHFDAFLQDASLPFEVGSQILFFGLHLGKDY